MDVGEDEGYSDTILPPLTGLPRSFSRISPILGDGQRTRNQQSQQQMDVSRLDRAERGG